jgi:hypothetical protein
MDKTCYTILIASAASLGAIFAPPARAAGVTLDAFRRSIGAAIAAECPWLRFYCSACRQIGEIDLGKL